MSWSGGEKFATSIFWLERKVLNVKKKKKCINELQLLITHYHYEYECMNIFLATVKVISLHKESAKC